MARILIVEDEFLIAASLEMALGEAGHAVRLAGNGRDALKAMDGFPPDVVVTDYMMPLMDGAELIARLRADPARSGLRIVLATAISQDALAGRVDGYDAYLSKPVREVDLLATIDRLLKETPAPPATGRRDVENGDP